MSYLIGQIFWCMLAALLLGFLIGWWLRQIRCRRETDELQARLADQPARAPAAVAPAPVVDSWIPGYPVEEIEGIGSGFGRRLRAEGIDSTDKLLRELLDSGGIQKICKACDIDESTARSWATMADLLRVPGVDGQWAELLWRCDVRDVQTLAGQQAESLLARMVDINTAEHRVPDLPDEDRLRHWIGEAARMPALLPD